MERWIQMTSGSGPQECDYAVHQLHRIFEEQARVAGIQIEMMRQEIRNNLICSVTFWLNGAHVDRFLKDWKGSICWVCKSPFRPQYRRKNWFIRVFEIPEIVSIWIDDKDILYQTLRSTAAGGQHKMNSAVRALHMPTGLTVQVMDTRSQYQNKKIAYTRLMEKIQKRQGDLDTETANMQRSPHSQITRGNVTRIFFGKQFITKRSMV
ncbi:peptide chain release factor H [Sphingobacterium suaedae]